MHACLFFLFWLFFVGSHPRQVNEAEVGMDFWKEAESKAREDMLGWGGGVMKTTLKGNKKATNRHVGLMFVAEQVRGPQLEKCVCLCVCVWSLVRVKILINSFKVNINIIQGGLGKAIIIHI